MSEQSIYLHWVHAACGSDKHWVEEFIWRRDKKLDLFHEVGLGQSFLRVSSAASEEALWLDDCKCFIDIYTPVILWVDPGSKPAGRHWPEVEWVDVEAALLPWLQSWRWRTALLIAVATAEDFRARRRTLSFFIIEKYFRKLRRLNTSRVLFLLKVFQGILQNLMRSVDRDCLEKTWDESVRSTDSRRAKKVMITHIALKVCCVKSSSK